MHERSNLSINLHLSWFSNGLTCWFMRCVISRAPFISFHAKKIREDGRATVFLFLELICEFKNIVWGTSGLSSPRLWRLKVGCITELYLCSCSLFAWSAWVTICLSLEFSCLIWVYSRIFLGLKMPHSESFFIFSLKIQDRAYFIEISQCNIFNVSTLNVCVVYFVLYVYVCVLGFTL